MTTRERFLKIMEGDPTVDHGPALEWAMWWDKTIEHWEKEGMPSGMSGEQVAKYFGLDSITQFWFSHYTADCPQPKSKYVGPGIVRNEEDYRYYVKLLKEYSRYACKKAGNHS